MRGLPLVLVLGVGACGLESSGRAPSYSSDAGVVPDVGIADVTIDRGSGVTEAGVKCGCLPQPGPGWTFVAYQRDGAPACTGAFVAANPRLVVEASGAPASCGCTCSVGTPATCSSTGANVTVWDNAVCFNNSFASVSGNPPCANHPNINIGNGGVSVKGTANLTPSGGTCAQPSTTKNVPAAQVHTGGACALTGALGSGCGSGDACVPDPPGGLSVCVLSETPNAKCPEGYKTQRSVGTAFGDTRDCGPSCTCALAPTCTAQAQFFSNDGCSSGNKEGLSFPLDGTCRGISLTGLDGKAFETVITATQKCNPSGYQPVGEVTPTGGFTICCP